MSTAAAIDVVEANGMGLEKRGRLGSNTISHWTLDEYDWLMTALPCTSN
jgi:hypothetical protein